MFNRKPNPDHSGTSTVAQMLAKPLRSLAVAAGSLVLAAQVFASSVVNINTADAETIAASLQGIGPVKAQAIVEYRREYGLFQVPDDIMKVTGIGPATFELLKQYLSVGAAVSKATGSTQTSSLASSPVAVAKAAGSN